jgi:hypothetical protein
MEEPSQGGPMRGAQAVNQPTRVDSWIVYQQTSAIKTKGNHVSDRED